MTNLSAQQALETLQEGNKRFVEGTREMYSFNTDRLTLAAGQNPFAVILSCSDSRVPPEIIFDRGLGDLFVIRVAGNIVTPEVLGSTEFATETFGTSLVVVLGHSNCGAVRATLDILIEGINASSKNLASLVSKIKPALEPLRTNENTQLMDQAVIHNVKQSVNQLQTSGLLNRRLGDGTLQIRGALYDLSSGQVDFLD